MCLLHERFTDRRPPYGRYGSSCHQMPRLCLWKVDITPRGPRQRLTFDEAALIQGIGVYVHLHIVLVPDISRWESSLAHQRIREERREIPRAFVITAGVDPQSCKPVRNLRLPNNRAHLVQFEPSSTSLDNVFEGFGTGVITLASKSKVHWYVFGHSKHIAHIEWGRRAGGSIGASGGTCTSADKCRGSACDSLYPGQSQLTCRGNTRLFALLGADEMYMGVDASSSQDFSLAGDNFRR